MSGDVWFIAEHEEGEVRGGSREIGGAARELAGEQGTTVGVICTAESGDLGTQLAPYADRVVVVLDPALDRFTPEGLAQALLPLLRSEDPAAVLLQHSHTYGRDLAPVLAARLEAGLATDCIGLEADPDGVVVLRSVFERKLVARQRICTRPAVVTCQRGGFLAPEVREGGEVETVDARVDAGAIPWELVSHEAAEAGEHDITEADIVVAGGRGVGDQEKWRVITDLADALGAAWGASRPVVDQGWVGHERQIGSSGKTVRPRLYFAIGISGAIQHVVGMRSSDVIVAINKDERAPIFEYADYGVVADLFDIVPRLTERLREAREG